MKKRSMALLLSLWMAGAEIWGASLPVMAAETTMEESVAVSEAGETVAEPEENEKDPESAQETVSEAIEDAIKTENTAAEDPIKEDSITADPTEEMESVEDEFAEEVSQESVGASSDESEKSSEDVDRQDIPEIASVTMEADDFAEDTESAKDSVYIRNPDCKLFTGKEMVLGDVLELNKIAFSADYKDTEDYDDWEYIDLINVKSSDKAISCVKGQDEDGTPVWTLTAKKIGQSTITIEYNQNCEKKNRECSYVFYVVPEEYFISIIAPEDGGAWPGAVFDLGTAISVRNQDEKKPGSFDKENMRIAWSSDREGSVSFAADSSDPSKVQVTVSDTIEEDENIKITASLMVKNENGVFKKRAAAEYEFTVSAAGYYSLGIENLEEIQNLRAGNSAQIYPVLKKYDKEHPDGAVVEDIGYQWMVDPSVATIFDENRKDIRYCVSAPGFFEFRRNTNEEITADKKSITVYAIENYEPDQEETILAQTCIELPEIKGFLSFDEPGEITVFTNSTKNVTVNTSDLPDGCDVEWKLGYYLDGGVYAFGEESRFHELQADESVYTVTETENGYCFTFDGAAYHQLLGKNIDKAYLYVTTRKDDIVQETIACTLESVEPSVRLMYYNYVEKLYAGEICYIWEDTEASYNTDELVEDYVEAKITNIELVMEEGDADTFSLIRDKNDDKWGRWRLVANKPGRAYVKASVVPVNENYPSATCTFEVYCEDAYEISIETDKEIGPGETVTLKAVVTHLVYDGNEFVPAEDTEKYRYNWHLPEMFELEKNLKGWSGEVDPDQPNICRITASKSMAAGWLPVEVGLIINSREITGTTCDLKFGDQNALYAASVAFNRNSLSLKVKQSSQLSVKVSPESAMDRYNWSSSDETVAKVNVDGKVTAVGNGTAVITVESTLNSDIKDECVVTVTTDATGVTLSKSSSYLPIGKNLTLTGTVAPSTTSNKTLTWTTSNSKIATVNSAGKVVAKASGTATITAKTANGKTAACKIVVPQVKLKKSSFTVLEGKTSNIEISSKYPTNDTVKSYKSSNTAVAKVNSSGKVTGVAGGTATITVTMRTGATAACKVTVQPVTKRLSLDRTSMTLQTRKSATLKVARNPSGAKETITWKSSNTSVATVNSSGKVTAVKAGTATITAQTSNGKKATCKVTVKNPSVTLTKTSGSIKVGKTVTIAIRSKFPANDTVKSYKSSNTSVATVNSKGVVKGVKAGSATITVTMASGAKASFKVTVTK